MIVLCSASPRRKEIFQNLGLEFQFFPPQINEDEKNNELPLEYLKRICISKAMSVREDFSNTDSPENFEGKIPDHKNSEIHRNNIFVASDTIVVRENQILHKPENPELAFNILSSLVGKEHTVYSGMAILIGDDTIWDYDETLIRMKNWGEKEIQNYLEEYKPLDKAGSYGIQDANGPVAEFKGSYTNVMGFPLRKFYRYIRLFF